MVQDNGSNQPPSENPEALILEGARNDPLLGDGDGGTSTEGAGERPAARTYSETEWNARQSALDKQVVEQRNIAGRLAMDLTAEKIRGAEYLAQAADQRSVEDGDLSQGQANQRTQQRAVDTQSAIERQQALAGYEAMMAHGEEVGRITAATDFAAEFGVEAKDLLSDPSLTGPDAMRNKARELALERRENALRTGGLGESFDGGGGGSGAGPGALDSLSPAAKIAYGLAHPPKGRR